MRISGLSLDENKVVIDTDAGESVKLVTCPDDGVIYLGEAPCWATSVEQTGFSEMLAALKIVRKLPIPERVRARIDAAIATATATE